MFYLYFLVNTITRSLNHSTGKFLKDGISSWPVDQDPVQLEAHAMYYFYFLIFSTQWKKTAAASRSFATDIPASVGVVSDCITGKCQPRGCSHARWNMRRRRGAGAVDSFVQTFHNRFLYEGYWRICWLDGCPCSYLNRSFWSRRFVRFDGSRVH